MTQDEDDELVGATITEIRPMTSEELATEGWTSRGSHFPPVCVVLDSGEKIYPSRDAEGNGPGALFGMGDDGTPFMLVRGVDE